jgi:hypothetical protein
MSDVLPPAEYGGWIGGGGSTTGGMSTGGTSTGGGTGGAMAEGAAGARVVRRGAIGGGVAAHPTMILSMPKPRHSRRRRAIIGCIPYVTQFTSAGLWRVPYNRTSSYSLCRFTPPPPQHVSHPTNRVCFSKQRALPSLSVLARGWRWEARDTYTRSRGHATAQSLHRRIPPYLE